MIWYLEFYSIIYGFVIEPPLKYSNNWRSAPTVSDEKVICWKE